MSTVEYGGYLPPKAKQMEIKKRVLSFKKGEEELHIHMPYPAPEQIQQFGSIMKTSAVQTMDTTEIIQAVSKVIDLLLERNHPVRIKAEMLLPIITGYDAEIIRLGLTQSLQTFREHELHRWLAVNFHSLSILDRFEPLQHGGYTKAIGPQLTAHVWAGNVPGLPLWSLIASLLVKGSVIGKVSSAEPFFIGLFCEILAEVEPRLANAMAIVSWQGGDSERESALFTGADAVIGYGTNKTITMLQQQVTPPAHFISFGNKLSFGLVHHQVLDRQKDEALAKQAALDIIRYDQQGCFSPHTFFVEKGGKTSPKQWAALLARKLQVYEERHPLRKLSIEEAGERAEWRNKKEWQESWQLFSSSKGSWIVAYGKEASIEPSPLSRVVHVIEIDNWQDMKEAVRDKRAVVQTMGIAAPVEELFKISTRLSAFGITRITSIGRMTKLHAGWHQDGRSLMRELVQLVDIDPSAVSEADAFNSYTD